MKEDSQLKLDRNGYVLEFEDNFSSTDLDLTKWLPYYLPQWKSRESSQARYQLDTQQLSLMIEEDQQPWAPEHNGEIRVSNLQTGVFAGPVGSQIGQHRFKEGLVVQQEQEATALYTPTFGLIELRSKAIKDPHCLVALWLIGFESDPEDSAEICVMEIFGKDVDDDRALVGVGIKKHHDPRVEEDFSKIEVQVDVCDWHIYSVEWTPESISFYLDGICLKTVKQAIDYPMQLMLNIYELARTDGVGSYPKEFAVDWVRGYKKQSLATSRPS